MQSSRSDTVAVVMPPEAIEQTYTGVRILKKGARAADAAGPLNVFRAKIHRSREQYRRRPTMIAMLDKAEFI